MSKLKRIMSILVLVLVLSIVGISGCTNTNDTTNQKPFYSGNWQVDAEHFIVKQGWIDAFVGSYDAYNNSGTITLVGKGTLASTNQTGDIKIVISPMGNNTNASYYLNNSLNSYQIIKGYNVNEVFKLNVECWEHRLGNDTQKLDNMDIATTTTKPA